MKNEKISCDVIQDLLPLYLDKCCSEHSKKLVEEHLKECEDCGIKQNEFTRSLPNMDLEDAETEAKQIRRGVRNIVRWKVAGILLVSVVLMVFLLIIPIINHVRGEGINYLNLKAIQTAYGFEHALASCDYEKAYSYLDIKGKYQDLLATDSENEKVMEGIREIEVKGFDWYNQIAKEAFIKNMNTLEEMNLVVNSYSGFHITKQPYGWSVDFNYLEIGSDPGMGMQLDISSDGIRNFYVFVKFVPIEEVPEGMSQNEAVEEKELLFSRLYGSPTINETVMEILYGETDYEWEKLFIY